MNIIFMHDAAQMEKHGISKAQFIDFLHTHLDRFRDSKEAIGEAVDYAFSKDAGRGGFVSVAEEGGRIEGGLLMIKTGMTKYIPENILVYVAVDSSKRGKGIGKELIEASLSHTDGNTALHVEYDNPAKRLYERIGFKSKYAEMRLER